MYVVWLRCLCYFKFDHLYLSFHCIIRLNTIIQFEWELINYWSAFTLIMMQSVLVISIRFCNLCLNSWNLKNLNLGYSSSFLNYTVSITWPVKWLTLEKMTRVQFPVGESVTSSLQNHIPNGLNAFACLVRSAFV
jgi:hypothetical protein